MKLTPALLEMDWDEVEKRIEGFIRDYVQKSRSKGLVLGLSGGVDSCTTAALSTKAIGGEKVLALLLPEKETLKAGDIQDAKAVVRQFRLDAQTIDITSTLASVYKSIPIFSGQDKISKGNLKARARMLYIYYYANKLNMLVCGSSDKSETMMGYFTKWGDVAADISPIMDLYKTQVRKLAQHIGIHETITTKPSSPTLWAGQLAEEELGMKYETLDLILYGLEHFMTIGEIAKELNIGKGSVERIKWRWLSTEHKRRMLLAPKIEYRTVGNDFRLPRNMQKHVEKETQ